jgi:putative Holliday junction resolvase
VYYIGIDWGLNKTGLAIADNELRIATVFGEVETGKLVGEIKKIQGEYGDVEVVFGGLQFTENFDSTNDREMDIEKEKCLEEIKALNIKIEIAEEMLSTKMAQQNLLESGRKKVSKQDNGESAKIILQGWLDSLEFGN